MTWEYPEMTNYLITALIILILITFISALLSSHLWCPFAQFEEQAGALFFTRNHISTSWSSSWASSASSGPSLAWSLAWFVFNRKYSLLKSSKKGWYLLRDLFQLLSEKKCCRTKKQQRISSRHKILGSEQSFPDSYFKQPALIFLKFWSQRWQKSGRHEKSFFFVKELSQILSRIQMLNDPRLNHLARPPVPNIVR